MAATTDRRRARRVRVPQWIGEIVLVGLIYGAYELLRGVHEGGRGTANHIAHTIVSWERTLHIDPERWLTVHLDKITWLAVPACYLYATAHYIVTPAVLVWLYVRHRYSYGRGRTWLAVSTLISLLIFYLAPTTPPRLLDSSYPDVMAHMSRYGWWGTAGSAPRGWGHLTNQFAAMPSMHVGWALWCGIMIWRCAPYLWVRILGMVYPAVVTVVVISTGNHYVLDTVAGALTMALGAAVTQGGYRAGRWYQARRRARAGGRWPEQVPPRPAAGTPQEAEAPGAQNSLHTTSG